MSINKRNYNQISQEEEPQTAQFEGPKDGKTARQVHKERSDRLEQIYLYVRKKIEGLIWISAACVIIHESNFFLVLQTSPNIDEFFMSICTFFFAIFMTLQIYTVMILPYCYGVSEEIEDYAPNVLYMGALSMFIFNIALIIAVWPIWGWKTIPMLLVMFLGFINVSQFIPGKLIGTILLGGIFVSLFFSHYLIDHPGKWHY